MRWPVVLIFLAAMFFLAAIFAGCQHPAVDPFFGQQTVPPPATGAVIGSSTETPPGDGYYSDTTPSPAADSDYAPPGGSFEFAGDRGEGSTSRTAGGFRPPSGSRVSTTEAEADDPTPRASGIPVRSINPDDRFPGRRLDDSDSEFGRPTLDNSQASRTAPTSRVVSRTRSALAKSGLDEPQRFPAEEADVRDLLELPEVRSDHSGFRRTTPARTASFTGGRGDAGGRGDGSQAATSTDVGSSYGYHPQYKWLRGKLEYSQSARRWKLRYIPISGATDEYGGSVVLDSSRSMDEYRPGDFVTVHGAVTGETSSSGGFAPSFRVERIAATR